MRKFWKNLFVCTAMASALLLGGCGGSTDSADSSTTNVNSTADDSTAGTEGTDAADTADGTDAKSDQSLQKVIDAGQLVLGLDATFKPMGYTNENDEIVGFDIDVAEEVCARLGVELVKEPINWETKEQDLNVGKIDCIWNGMSINASRAEEMNLSEAYMKNSMVFVVPGESKAESMADLEDTTIAVQNGSTAQEILEASDLADKITVTAIATNVEALQQMELGVVDAVFLDSVVANYEITSAGKDYIVLPDGLEEEEYAIGFRKEDQALRDRVQEILHDMKADGKLGEISTEWFGSDITTVE